MNENINNTVETVDTAQNVNNTEATPKASIGQRIWNGTKTTAKAAALGAATVAYVVVNVAAVALPLAACVKYLRED